MFKEEPIYNDLTEKLNNTNENKFKEFLKDFLLICIPSIAIIGGTIFIFYLYKIVKKN